MVDDLFQGAAVAEAVIENFGRDWGERQRGVDGEAELVFGEAHLVFDAAEEGQARRFDEVQIPGLELFVVEVQLGEFFAGCGEGAEVGGEGDAGQLALEVVGVLLAIAGMVQQAIDIVEDGPTGSRSSGSSLGTH